MGLVAPRHVESSWTRDRTSVPCFGGLILTTVLPGNILDETSFSFNLNLEFRFLILCVTE